MEIEPLQLYVPGEALKPYVDYFWYYPAYKAPHPYECILPHGLTEFQISLNEAPFVIHTSAGHQVYPNAFITSGYMHPFWVETHQAIDILSVKFKAGAAFLFFGEMSQALFNRHTDLQTLWGASANEWVERLREASLRSTLSCFQELERLLYQRLKQVSIAPRVKAMLNILDHASLQRSEALTQLLECSAPTLLQLYRQHIGVTPRKFTRVRRLANTLQQLAQFPQHSLSRLAYQHGFADQSHLNHEFKNLLGFTPQEYAPQNAYQGFNLPCWELPL